MLTVFSIITNVLVMHTITNTPTLSMTLGCYIISLAVGDFLQAVIVIPVAADFNIFGSTKRGSKFWTFLVSFHES
jgi:hypothetical protein